MGWLNRNRSPIIVVALAGVATAGGLALGTGAVAARWLESGTTPGLWRLALGCAIATVSVLLRLRLRVDNGAVDVTWGEAAVIFLCHLLPPGWVPAAVLVGAGVAQTGLSIVDRRLTAGVILRSAARSTLAASVAVLVAQIVGAPYDRPLSIRTAVALLLAAVCYGLTSTWLVTAQLADHSGPAMYYRVIRGKLPMVVGNILVGLLAVAGQVSWLVLLPPLVWLLQQTFAYRLRLDDERRTWQVFSEVAGKLNRHDEPGAATAGIEGALRLFPASLVEVVVGEGDSRRVYTGLRDGRAGPADGAADLRAGAGNAACRQSHQLVVRGNPIGELRLRIDPPDRCTKRDRLMLAAYGDALAAALHDAATHQELRAIVDQSSYDAVHDPLTGMVNRGALLTKGNTLLRQLRPGTPVALLLLDVNHFKEVNNTLGHEAGDELLQVIALRLASGTRQDDILARLGGDEFALLLTELPPEDGSELAASLDHAVGRARWLAEQIAAPTEVCGVVLSVEAAVGVVATTAGEMDMTELLRRADIAMYQAKRGSGGVAWYEPAGDDASVDRLALLAELREALGVTDQLTVLLQPMVTLETGRPVAAEALVRWRHPRRGLLEPDQFLPAVEQSELVVPFTRYVLEAALEIVAGWRVVGIDLPISVNLSARSLVDRTLVADLAEMLRRRGVPPDRLVLEIRESVVLSELATVEEVLAAMRAVGVGLAVDDFGSGFSSLTFLSRVPVNELKIDGAFVGQMVESAEAAAIVRTTVDLGRRLELRVVAEGVETPAQRLALIELGCRYAQGYYFYRPLPAERATLVLAETLIEPPNPGRS